MFSAFLAGVYRMPYRRFLLYNATGGILWALTFGLLGAAFGSQWPLLERWAGRAGLLIGGLLLLIGLALALWRWAVRHEADLRARWAAFQRSPHAIALRRRYARPIAFLQARLSPAGYLGLQLTVGLVVILAGAWLFGGIAEDVLTGDPLVAVDLAVNDFLSTHAAPALTSAMRWITLAGGTPMLIAGVGVAVYLLARRRWADTGLLALAVGGGELLVQLLKTLLARPRPVSVPLPAPGGYSFPSQHAMVAIIFYGLLCYLIVRDASSWRRRVRAVVIGAVLVILIGFSRLYLGQHYLSDVLGGYAAGVVWLASTISAVETLRRRRWSRSG